MIVCLCNALNDRAVRTAVDAGACSPHGVHRHHGTRINCGQCLSTISDIIREEDSEKPPQIFQSAAE